MIPLKLESPDRHANFQIITQFLNENFNTNIFVYELGVKSFNESGIKEEVPLVPDLVEDIDNVTTFFSSGFDNGRPIPFYRTKYLNHMLKRVKTPIVINYDSDVLVDPLNLVRACENIRSGDWDLVYPFGLGKYQYNIEDKDLLRSRASSLGWSESTFLNCSQAGWYALEDESLPSHPLGFISLYGHAQVFSTKSYKEGGGENERFKGWGPEDKERYYRFRGLGYKVKHMAGEKVFHIDHMRGPDSSNVNNPTFLDGWKEAFTVVNLPREEMPQYVKELKEYNDSN